MTSNTREERPSDVEKEIIFQRLSNLVTSSKFEGKNDEIDLREIWKRLWKGKWIILAVSASFAVMSVVYALSLPNIYQSEALLVPSEDAQGGGVSRMAGQLGGLASLAGINMGANSVDKVAVAMEVLTSRKFIGDFIEKYNILPELMAVKAWNRSNGQLIFDADIFNVSTKKWVREVDPPKSSVPSAWEAYKVFTKLLTVSRDKDTGFVTVEFLHQSPDIAKKWTEQLVANVNEVMKEADVEEARRSIAFLEGQLKGVALADMRTVFYQLIEEQTKTVMLAEVRDEYVFSTIDPPVVAEEKSKPKRALISILGVLIGGAIGVLIVLFRDFLRHESRNGI